MGLAQKISTLKIMGAKSSKTRFGLLFVYSLLDSDVGNILTKLTQRFHSHVILNNHEIIGNHKLTQ